MTNDYKRLAGQLAMGINFAENAVVMATQIDRGSQKAEVNFYAKGERIHVRTLIIEIIKQYLSNFDGEEASFECGALMTAFTRVDKKESNAQSNDNTNIPIEDYGFSVRAYNCLKRAGINVVSDIKSVEQLRNTRNLGARCLQEIVDKLKKNGTELPESEIKKLSAQDLEKFATEFVKVGSGSGEVLAPATKDDQKEKENKID